MAVVGGGKEGALDGAEGCSVKILGKFACGNVLAEDNVCLVCAFPRSYVIFEDPLLV